LALCATDLPTFSRVGKTVMPYTTTSTTLKRQQQCRQGKNKQED